MTTATTNTAAREEISAKAPATRATANTAPASAKRVMPRIRSTAPVKFIALPNINIPAPEPDIPAETMPAAANIKAAAAQADMPGTAAAAKNKEPNVPIIRYRIRLIAVRGIAVPMQPAAHHIRRPPLPNAKGIVKKPHVKDTSVNFHATPAAAKPSVRPMKVPYPCADRKIIKKPPVTGGFLFHNTRQILYLPRLNISIWREYFIPYFSSLSAPKTDNSEISWRL